MGYSSETIVMVGLDMSEDDWWGFCNKFYDNGNTYDDDYFVQKCDNSGLTIFYDNLFGKYNRFGLVIYSNEVDAFELNSLTTKQIDDKRIELYEEISKYDYFKVDGKPVSLDDIQLLIFNYYI